MGKKNAYSSFIYNLPELEAAKMSLQQNLERINNCGPFSQWALFHTFKTQQAIESLKDMGEP